MKAPYWAAEGVAAMHRDEALNLLNAGSEGIAGWNRRRKSGEETPGLREGDLRYANLAGPPSPA
jgi:hypothetical protein